MANEIKLTFAGDAQALQRASAQATQATRGVADAAATANDSMARASQEATGFAGRVGQLGAAVDGASTAISDIGGGVQALADFQAAGANRAAALARAQADVEQAMIDAKQAVVDLEQAQRDLSQSQIDGQQAGVDAKQAAQDQAQAALDAEAATKAYKAAVAEHGKGSAEAKQALLDMNQAVIDAEQANVDAAQAAEDAKQATLDGRQANVDAAQAMADATSAQLDLNDAQREANPTDLQKFADQLNMVTPLLSALVGVVALVTAAQWAWNAAQLASPTTWIVLAIVALVAIIILIATKTDWFQKLWRAAWSGIKAYIEFVKDRYVQAFNIMIGIGKKLIDGVMAIPGLLKKAWNGLFNLITAPWRAAFNFIADAWNNTVGKLQWTVPGWVPGIGGRSIGAPKLPKFHTGGTASGALGGEFLAILRAGERVTPTGGNAGGSWILRVEPGGGTSTDKALADLVARLIDRGAIKLRVMPNGRVAVAR